MQYRKRGNVHQELLHVEPGRNQRLAKAPHRAGTISEHRLLYNLIKQLLDEGVLGLFTGGGELSHITGARQSDRLTLVGRVIANHIDWPIILASAEATDRIIMFQAEAEGID